MDRIPFDKVPRPKYEDMYDIEGNFRKLKRYITQRMELRRRYERVENDVPDGDELRDSTGSPSASE